MKNGGAGCQEVHDGGGGCFNIDSIVHKWSKDGPFECKTSDLTYGDYVLSYNPTRK